MIADDANARLKARRAELRRMIDAGIEQARRGQLVDGPTAVARLRRRLARRAKRGR